ncbi:type I glutamate--ammonia ligase [Corynebacterium sp. 335C]
MSFTTAQEVIDFINREDVKFVDVRFTDVPGTEQHLTIPAAMFDEDAMTEGLAFDGSSIRGFTTIDESDMTLLPDLATAHVDPFREAKTLNVKFFVHDPFTHEPFSRDPRNIARKAEEYLESTGIADTCFIGAEAEFFVFDRVSYAADVNTGFFHVDSVEGWWNRSADENPDGSPNLGYKTRMTGGYFPVAPYDHFQDLRDEMSLVLEKCGFQLERQHHEVGTGGQQEINYRFNSLLHAADDMQVFKYVVRNTARRAGKAATFMPKPLGREAGSGMHAHVSLWKDGEPLFHDEDGYAGLSDMARHFIGGVLEHARALTAFTNPTLNSYRRLIPGFEAPTNLVYSQRNRSAAIRIPITGSNPKAKRIEFRAPDPSANPYLAFTAILMAGLDGVRNRTEPHEPVDKDIYELPPEEARDIPETPASLSDALDALEADHEFLLEGDVFTGDLLRAYVAYKREREIAPSLLHPTPYEYETYFDA